jgi:hypothetical protein
MANNTQNQGQNQQQGVGTQGNITDSAKAGSNQKKEQDKNNTASKNKDGSQTTGTGFSANRPDDENAA